MSSRPAAVRPHELIGIFPDPDLEMPLNCRGNVADVLRLIVGARDAQLIHIDVEAGAIADAQAAHDPYARADPARDHRRDRYALGRITEKRHLDPLRIVEVGDEAEPASLAHIVHDQPRGLLSLFLARRAPAAEQPPG